MKVAVGLEYGLNEDIPALNLGDYIYLH